MKVLHVISSVDSKWGGPVSALRGLTLALRHAGAEVSVLGTFKEGDDTAITDQLRAEGVEVTLVGPTKTPLAWHPRLKSAAIDAVSRVDVVHIHALWEAVQHHAATAARALGKPYVFRPCGMLDPWSLAQGRWKKRIYMAWRLRKDLNRATAIHFTADLERDLIVPLRLRAPSIVEPNGVDFGEFESLPNEPFLRRRYPAIEGKRIVLFLSRLHHKKGLELLLPAFARLDRSDVVLVIAGPDQNQYRTKLEDLCGALGIADRVVFTGMLVGRERVAALAEADLFCLPSYQENFGIAVVESLAAGTPVVISDQVNIYKEILAAGVGGVVPLDVDALAAEIRRWLADPGLLQAAAGRARPFVMATYQWTEIARRWMSHYTRLCRSVDFL